MSNYVANFSAYKPSGKYYSGQYHVLFESGINNEHVDFNQIWDLISILEKDLDAACGLVQGTIAQCGFDVVVNVYNENWNKQEDRGVLTRIIRFDKGV